MDDQKYWGTRLSIGSASDHPFSNLDVTTFTASGFYSWNDAPHSRWMLTLFVSNNNPILNYAPIPGFVYIYQLDNFIGMFGFPFTSILWMPTQDWTYTFGIFGPTINTEIAYGNAKKAQVYVGYSWNQQSYIPENRPSNEDRLYYADMRTPFGVRIPIAGVLKTDLAVGYAFDRSVFEGTKVRESL